MHPAIVLPNYTCILYLYSVANMFPNRYSTLLVFGIVLPNHFTTYLLGLTC